VPVAEKHVRDYYSSSVHREWDRLVKDPYHRLEFATTLTFLKKYLPKHGRILDAGGGPGRYTIELARLGHRVTLLDLSPANITFAQRRIKRAKVQDRVDLVVEGSIVDLSRFADGQFDAVICLGGPLSHVVDGRRRGRAVGELVRVCRSGSPIIASVMGRLGILVWKLTQFPHEIGMPFFTEVRDSGDYFGSAGFTECHFFLPDELKAAFQKRGVKVLEMVGLEGVGSNQIEAVNKLHRNRSRWTTWIESHYKTCTQPSVVGMSEHLLIVCKKA
jgi:SAM-dependent methyltransferase